MALAVITVLSPACRTADSAAGRPEVKFRFTGVFPANTQPRLAIVPPAPGGSKIPTRGSGTSCLIRRANAKPAPNRTPALIFRPPIPASTSTSLAAPRAKPCTQAQPRESLAGLTRKPLPYLKRFWKKPAASCTTPGTGTPNPSARLETSCPI